MAQNEIRVTVVKLKACIYCHRYDFWSSVCPLINPYIGFLKVPALKVRADLGVMAMKAYSSFPNAPVPNPYHHTVSCYGLVWFLCLMTYQLFLGYLMPNPLVLFNP